jgi:alpha-glucoside transport system substrate-binding protein
MAYSTTRRGISAVTFALGLSLVLAACGGDDGDNGDGDGGDDDTTGLGAGADCDALVEEYGDLSDTEITMYSTIIAPEDAPLEASFDKFEECTGATIIYEGSDEFEAQLPVRVEGGTPPDMAILPQPGLLRTLVEDYPDAVVPAPEQVEANVDEFFSPDWKAYGTVDDTYYAAPFGANVKSFVWYSPTAFADAGYEVPETWDDMLALSDQIVADGGKPWCAGVGSGEATGWPATDWVEDVVLRTAGPEVYDQWYTHERPADHRGHRHGRRGPQERGLRQRRSGRCRQHRDDTVRGRRSADHPGPVLHASPGVVLRCQLARGHRGRRGRRHLRLLPAADR